MGEECGIWVVEGLGVASEVIESQHVATIVSRAWRGVTSVMPDDDDDAIADSTSESCQDSAGCRQIGSAWSRKVLGCRHIQVVL